MYQLINFRCIIFKDSTEKVKGTVCHWSSFMIMQEYQGVFKIIFGLNWKNITPLSNMVNF